MQEQLERRLQELQAEFEAGQKMLAELEAQQARLRDTLLPISGGIQVLGELQRANPKAGNGAKALQTQRFSLQPD